jgi:phenylacetic acid degradation operon negative regulatory protein
MKKKLLHHPNVSVTVLRRRVADFFLEVLAYYGQVAVRRGRSPMWSGCFPSRRAYCAAANRLQKKGVVEVARRPDGQRVLHVARGREMPESLNPEKHWRRPWDGIWRVLVYDVPENERSFRNGLRRLLYRLRMGYLQHSVWISPWDIRPEYADIETTLHVNSVAFLFEAYTVLGRRSSDLVLEAWDFERLAKVHQEYLAASRVSLAELRSPAVAPARVEILARQEMMAYLHAMENDPLLPNKLQPFGYLGHEVYEQHAQVAREVRQRLGL